MTPPDSVLDADPSSGLPAGARGGLRARTDGGRPHAASCRCGGADRDGLGAPEAGSRPSEAGGFVRAAAQADLPAMGRVHAASMLASLAAGHDGPLPEGVRAMVSAPVIAAGWESAVVAPPTRAHHALVATAEGAVVGLLGLAPTEAVTTEGPDGVCDSDPSRTAERPRPPRSQPSVSRRPTSAAGTAPGCSRRPWTWPGTTAPPCSRCGPCAGTSRWRGCSPARAWSRPAPTARCRWVTASPRTAGPPHYER